ncbi:hypothetical protein DERF_000515 [Dermatophagoides farinae]|uniref:Uncharacterized protein n=1 Tax=Dermatophagoides farinae TaxID=6954 RepID=A0A922L8D4_DERFA|nr:hypothetical protein DERF_000515 [Dermatophagoides farinae]
MIEEYTDILLIYNDHISNNNPGTSINNQQKQITGPFRTSKQNNITSNLLHIIRNGIRFCVVGLITSFICMGIVTPESVGTLILHPHNACNNSREY